ncbi:MAG: hypothetical protein HYX92_09190 [Chloroflexi bacterium]|nr:hypothetical protein [Chloroflexota bacterium]
MDLASGAMVTHGFDVSTLRKYLGGLTLGVKTLYEEVSRETGWEDPANRLVIASGPLNGTRYMGSGGFSVTTKGPMTNGATSTQAMGFFGAYMKLSGFDGLIIQGAAERPVYLYLHDGAAELRDASRLKGFDTKQTDKAIREELGKGQRDLSIFSIGPAGENLVRYAVLTGDAGHVAAHNGVGAVMGIKGLKALVAARGEGRVPVKDDERLRELVEEMFKSITEDPVCKRGYEWGTSWTFGAFVFNGLLPVKNYATSVFWEHEKFRGEYYRRRFQMTPNPCWRCRMHHCHLIKVTEGPYAGYEGEEPEYEQWASWGPQIGQDDPGAAVVLSNEADQLGMDANEASWTIGLAMECYEKGLISKSDTDGIDLTWGNAEAVRALLRKIALRQGFGNVLAEGAKRAAALIGGEAPNMAIHTLKGNTPRSHDDRANWMFLLDHGTSNTGTSESLAGRRALPPDPVFWTAIDPFSPEAVSEKLAKEKGLMQFLDSLVACSIHAPPRLEAVVEALNAVTGWDFDTAEAMDIGRRAVNLMRVFDISQGLGAELDAPSPRFGSAPVDGPAKGTSIMPVWQQMVRNYYANLGWDEETGKPKPETLRALGLGHLISDIWRECAPQ